MKKLCIKIAVFCLLMIATILCIIFLLPFPEHSYNLAIIDKHRILANTKSPKLALAGGSNLAFGIDSAAIAGALNLPMEVKQRTNLFLTTVPAFMVTVLQPAG